MRNEFTAIIEIDGKRVVRSGTRLELDIGFLEVAQWRFGYDPPP